MASIIRVDDIQDSGGNTIVSSNGSGTFTNNLGVSNTPAFGVKLSSSQGLTDGALTKITWGTELWDTDSAFSSGKFTVPSGKAGKYFFTTNGYADGLDSGEHFFLAFYKNGSRTFREVGWTSSGSDFGMRAMASVTLDLAVGDYVEVYAYQNEGSVRDLQASYSQFSGHRLIGV